MKIIGRILLTLLLLAFFSFAVVQIGCQDTSPKNVDNDKQVNELEMPDISDGEDEDGDDEDDDDDDSSPDASLSGPKN